MDQNYTHISVVLDRSGSMSSIMTDTIGGFNQFLKDQKAVKSKATFSLLQFDTEFQEDYIGKDIQEVPELTDKTFVPRGMTALLDAIGHTINKTGEWLKNIPEAIRPGKVVFVILTDGAENSSHEFSKSQIFDMIKKQTDVFKWGFVFLGANQDAIQEAHGLGIFGSNSLTYKHTGDGIKKSMFAASVGVSGMRGSSMNAADYALHTGYISQEDKDAQGN